MATKRSRALHIFLLLTENQIIKLLCAIAVDRVINEQICYSREMTHVTRSVDTAA